MLSESLHLGLVERKNELETEVGKLSRRLKESI